MKKRFLCALLAVFIACTLTFSLIACEIDPLNKKGTKSNPFTVSEAIAKCEKLGLSDEEYSQEYYYVKGTVKDTVTKNGSSPVTYSFELVDEKGTDSITARSLYLAEDVAVPAGHDTVLVYGKIQNNNGAVIVTSASTDTDQAQVKEIVKTGLCKITAINDEHATINLSKTEGENRTKFTYTVTVDEGWHVLYTRTNNVTHGHDENGVYTGTIDGDTVVTVVVAQNREPYDEYIDWYASTRAEGNKWVDGQNIRDEIGMYGIRLYLEGDYSDGQNVEGLYPIGHLKMEHIEVHISQEDGNRKVSNISIKVSYYSPTSGGIIWADTFEEVYDGKKWEYPAIQRGIPVKSSTELHIDDSTAIISFWAGVESLPGVTAPVEMYVNWIRVEFTVTEIYS